METSVQWRESDNPRRQVGAPSSSGSACDKGEGGGGTKGLQRDKRGGWGHPARSSTAPADRATGKTPIHASGSGPTAEEYWPSLAPLQKKSPRTVYLACSLSLPLEHTHFLAFILLPAGEKLTRPGATAL